MVDYKTVRLPREIVHRIEALKRYPRETYGDVLERLMKPVEARRDRDRREEKKAG